MSGEIDPWNRALAIFKPIEKFLSKIISPPLKEIGELLVDKVRFWRFKNQVDILKKSDEYLKKRNINPKKISLKVLVPLLEAGSLEEDEFMQDKWAALLASAINSDYEEEIRPSYVEILKVLSPLEVKLLDDIYKTRSKIPREKRYDFGVDKEGICKFLNISDEDYEILIDNLFRLNLLMPPITRGGIVLGTNIRVYDFVFLTPLGYSFVKACKFENDTESGFS